MKTIDQLSIRRQNIARIWELFSVHPTLTRQELAQGTGLSLMTVTNLVDHLNRYHVLDFSAPAQQAAPGLRNAGRKADQISLCTTRHAWLIIDLTDIYFRFSALALDLSPLIPSMIFSYDQERDYVLNLLSFLRKVRETIDKELKNREILGVAIVVPGPYDIEQDVVINKRLPALNTLKMKKTLREELGLYDYYVDEDVKFAVRAFMSLATRNNSEVLYYLYLGEGVGGATIHNGNVLRGLNAAAGDAGQLLSSKGGTFESHLSLRSFAKDCGLSEISDENEDALLNRITQYSLNDFSRYQAALLRSADEAADMLHAVIWLLDPGQVVIDCPYARPCQEQFISRISSRLNTLLGGTVKAPEILPSPYEMRSVLLGAAQVLGKEWFSRIV